MPRSRGEAALLLLAFALGLYLRLAWVKERAAQPPVEKSWQARLVWSPPYSTFRWLHDEYLYYVSTAVNAFNGQGLVPDYNRARDGIFVPPPGQALFMLALFEPAGRLLHPYWLLVAQAAIGAALVFPAAAVARRMASSAAAMAMAVAVAIHPDFVFWCGYLMTESNYLVGLGVVLWLLCRWQEQPTDARALLAALGLGLLHLQRMNGMLLGPALALYALGRLGRRGWRPALMFALVPYLVLTPWLARNLHRYGEPIWVSSNAGVHFHFANHLELDPRRTPYLEQVVARDPPPLVPAIEQAYRGPDGRLKATYYRYSKAYMAVARDYVRHHPLHFLRNLAIKFVNQFWLVQDGGRVAVAAFRSPLAYRLLHAAVLGGGVAGAVALLLRRRGPALCLVLTVFLFYAGMGSLSILATDGRYSLNLTYFLLLLATAGGEVLVRGAFGRPAA